MSVEVLENGQFYRNIPIWMQYLIDIGFTWQQTSRQERTITLISMPCDSPAAGLVSLGAVIGGLTMEEANEFDDHYDSLLGYARQYLKFCKTCELSECKPELKKCGYSVKVSGKLRNTNKPRGQHVVSPSTDFDREFLAIQTPGTRGSGPVTSFPRRKTALEWFIDGAPPVQAINSTSPLAAKIYKQIKPEANILPDNLARSYMGFCLAGRVTGANFTKLYYDEIGFGEECAPLSNLLPLYDWVPRGGVVRGNFYNSRTNTISWPLSSPANVVVDGIAAFLKVINDGFFQRSNILCVVSRASDREQLHSLADAMSNLANWYRPDEETIQTWNLPDFRAIDIYTLKRSHS